MSHVDRRTLHAVPVIDLPVTGLLCRGRGGEGGEGGSEGEVGRGDYNVRIHAICYVVLT